MVMDATQSQQPSPQSVGREFVRQYYTLLNRAPNHLHRFYNNNSSFIHGESTLVVGQRNIHNRIQQLNFHDCHAKISQVDAQATLGNGVVVQVTGELSNDGQPMRRFTQTFVLASQSPKKYYVHNDIFRYQDMYSDEENDGETRSENDDEHDQQQQPALASTAAPGSEPVVLQVGAGTGAVTVEPQQQQPIQQAQLSAQVVATPAGAAVLPQQQLGAQATGGAPQQQAIYYSVPAAGGRPVPLLAATAPPQGAAAVPLAAQFSAAAPTPSVPQQVQLNGVVGHEDILSAANQQQQQQPGAGQQQLVAPTASPVVPQSAGGSVNVPTPVIAAQTVPAAGIAAVPVAASTTIPQNSAANITGFQQSALLQPHVLQQQPLPQPLVAQTLASQQPTTVEFEDGGISPHLTSGVESDPRTGSANILAAAADNIQVVDDFKAINEQQQQEKYEAAKQQQQQQNEPKTYANLFKSTSSSPSGFVTAAMQQQQQLQQQQLSSNNTYQSTTTISSTTYSQSNTNTTSSLSVYNTRNSDSSSLRLDNNNFGSVSQGGPLPQRSNTTRINKEYEPRRTSNAQQSDNQQLFLGNIPHHASEEELKALFSRFGQVLELRVMSKASSGKLPPGARNPQNFGFITYEDAESVQNCLSQCPLYFPDNSPDGQKLNVEEKKPRIIRPNDMPPRQPMGGSSMGGNINNSQRNMSGGPPTRSLSNSAGGTSGMMRNTGGSGTNTNSMSRGQSTGGGPRIGGFNRSENRSGPTNGGGPQVRGGNQNSTQTSGGGGSSSYGTRR
ncbi:ras GTPase-activating protein-binding protein 2-like [Rhagoletis pomonella]|uniref:ras GTPase-activating protein-binding protein 2-like n=1 Tax=Rhagoletis pomonella TaxID=28610 RepID=UPI0017875A4A|nr:ras GTPase-activating protein-binding protein 2-like [Rhagoletis pomonella]